MFILKLTKVLIKLKDEKFDEKKDTKLKTREKEANHNIFKMNST